MKRLLALMTICLAAGGAPPERIRVLFLTGQTDLPYHDWRISTPFLRGVLAGTGRFDVKVIEEVRGVTAATLAGADVLVLNYNGPRWGDATENAIEEFVKSGKGLVSFHGVTYGEFYGQVFGQRWTAGATRGWLAYPRLVGAQWDPPKIGHGARHVFTVKWVDRGHPISAGLDESFLANDELYHKLDLLPDTKVLATAFSAPETGGTGRDEPIVWTTAFGRGRSVHITLGHDLSAMSQPGFLTAFARGAEWAATGAVTLPARITAGPAARKDAVRLLVVTGGHSYPSAFYTLFEGYDDIVWTHAASPKEAFTPKMKDNFELSLCQSWESLPDLPSDPKTKKVSWERRPIFTTKTGGRSRTSNRKRFSSGQEALVSALIRCSLVSASVTRSRTGEWDAPLAFRPSVKASAARSKAEDSISADS